MTAAAPATPLAGAQPLIDVHAHFWHARSGRSDWEAVNAARLRAGARIGIWYHVASILGSWGFSSPVYFPSPQDVSAGNTAMLDFAEAHADCVRAYVTVNPNHTAHAVEEIDRGVARGAVGVKLAASRRASDPLLDPVCDAAARHGLPILHHIWQHRTREWPSQEISDGRDLAELALRHPTVSFILAHIGGGGDYMHTLAAIAGVPNILADLSGSGVDRGMLDEAMVRLGVDRLVWGSDVTMETGLAKLMGFEAIRMSADDVRRIRADNARRIFPRHSFHRIDDAVGLPTAGPA